MDKNRFELRLLCEKDADRMLEWLHNEDVTKYLQLNGKNLIKSDAVNFIIAAQNIEKDLHFAIVNEVDEYQGTVSLKNINPAEGSAEYAISMHPSAVGNGASRAGTELILQVAFEQRGLDFVYLNVLEENQRAVRFYEKLGFTYQNTTNITFRGEDKKLLWYQMKRASDLRRCDNCD